MLRLNKDIIVYPQGLAEDEIREQLQQYVVGETINGHEILPIIMFCLTVPVEKNNVDDWKLITIYSSARTYLETIKYPDGHIEQNTIRTHYSEAQVQKFLNIIEEYGAIKDFR